MGVELQVPEGCMKVQSINISQIKDITTLVSYLQQTFNQTIQVINGRLTFKDNLQSITVSVTIAASGTDVKVQHALGYVPSGFLPINQNTAAVVYTGVTNWTAQSIYVRGSAAVTATLMIF